MERVMTVLRGFAITLFSGLFFGVGGAAVGYALGRWTPDFYRTVFRIPIGSTVDPIEVGLGLGLSNGGIIGLGIGLVIVLAVTWSNGRLASGK
jgi:hypothetical protein